MEEVMLKCGCVSSSIHRNNHDELGENHPSCIVHDCCEVVESPNLKGRKARCTYYGKAVETGMYNANCCDKCAKVELCECEEPSSLDLWFFKHKPGQEYDEFYCACQGAD